MPARIVAILAIVASIIIGVSFIAFAVDETQSATDHQRKLVQSGNAAYTADGKLIERDAKGRKLLRGDLRKRIDRVNDALTGPAASLVEDRPNRWVRRGVPFLLGLFFYGFGGLFFARYLLTMRHHL